MYYIPAVKHEFAKNGIYCKIPQTLNSMPKNLSDKIETHSMDGFKRYIKETFTNNYPSECIIQNVFVCTWVL
jgi:hypothetical protein